MADHDTVHYRRGELANVAEAGEFKLKITAECGETKWLRLTPAEFIDIRARLLTEDTAETVSAAARVEATLAYANAVAEPNRIALEHIRSMLRGERDEFVRTWQEYVREEGDQA